MPMKPTFRTVPAPWWAIWSALDAAAYVSAAVDAVVDGTCDTESGLQVEAVVPPPPEVPPQANANGSRVAAARTPSPLARTIWFPLGVLGRHEIMEIVPPPIRLPLPN